MAGSDLVQYSLDQVMTIVEDLMRVADDLLRGGNEVNAFLVDQVVNQLLSRAFGAD